MSNRELTKKAWETYTVKDLRAEAKKRGLKQEENGKKYTKDVLIDMIMKYDSEEEEIQKDMELALEPSDSSANPSGEWEEDNSRVDIVELKENELSEFNPQLELEKIVGKYKRRKPQEVYDNILKPQSSLVFVHVVETRSGEKFKKLRTAKAVAVNRKRELVKVETFFGTKITLSFDDILFVCAPGFPKYPGDIVQFLRKQKEWNIIRNYKKREQEHEA